ncbi:MAG: hypothetical protein ACJ76F_13790 [Bacteroidia bacterium]
MATDKKHEDNNDLVIHFLTHRKVLGWMGFLLPFVLMIGSKLLYGELETSISNYFYTCFRDVFVVTLCGVALFLFAYKGYKDSRDSLITNLAGVFGLLTAFIHTSFKSKIHLPSYQLLSQRVDPKTDLFLPLDPGCIKICEPYSLTPGDYPAWLGITHLVCAMLFFFTLAYMSGWQFTKTSGALTPEKILRNKIYKFCAGLIIFCILALIPCFALGDNVKAFYNQHKLIFWAESTSLWAFGFSWLVKGEFILKDKEEKK